MSTAVSFSVMSRAFLSAFIQGFRPEDFLENYVVYILSSNVSKLFLDKLTQQFGTMTSLELIPALS